MTDSSVETDTSAAALFTTVEITLALHYRTGSLCRGDDDVGVGRAIFNRRLPRTFVAGNHLLKARPGFNCRLPYAASRRRMLSLSSAQIQVPLHPVVTSLLNCKMDDTFYFLG